MDVDTLEFVILILFLFFFCFDFFVSRQIFNEFTDCAPYRPESPIKGNVMGETYLSWQIRSIQYTHTEIRNQ